MSDLAPVLQAFFTERLGRQLGASVNTVASYRDTFRLLLEFARTDLGKQPARLALVDLDAPFISRFLDQLERGRHNTTRTRNTRLAAIHSFFRFAAYRAPAEAATVQRVLSIPHKRFDRREVAFLTPAETEALVRAPDSSLPSGRRDKLLLLVAVETGMRVSEITAACVQDVVLGKTSHLRCSGKGRKERATPLRAETARWLRDWLRARGPGHGSDPLFPNARGGRLTRDGVAHLVRKHHRRATEACPTLGTKRVTPHVLRHTAAMRLLEAGVDRAVIAMWLGHESVETTQVYFHADLGLKERTLSRSRSTSVGFVRFKPQDKLLAFLTSL